MRHGNELRHSLADLHLMEAIVCLLQELLQPLELTRFQVRLIRILIPNERASERKTRTQHYAQDMP